MDLERHDFQLEELVERIKENEIINRPSSA